MWLPSPGRRAGQNSPSRLGRACPGHPRRRGKLGVIVVLVLDREPLWFGKRRPVLGSEQAIGVGDRDEPGQDDDDVVSRKPSHLSWGGFFETRLSRRQPEMWLPSPGRRTGQNSPSRLGRACPGHPRRRGKLGVIVVLVLDREPLWFGKRRPVRGSEQAIGVGDRDKPGQDDDDAVSRVSIAPRQGGIKVVQGRAVEPGSARTA